MRSSSGELWAIYYPCVISYPIYCLLSDTFFAKVDTFTNPTQIILMRVKFEDSEL